MSRASVPDGSGTQAPKVPAKSPSLLTAKPLAYQADHLTNTHGTLYVFSSSFLNLLLFFSSPRPSTTPRPQLQASGKLKYCPRSGLFPPEPHCTARWSRRQPQSTAQPVATATELRRHNFLFTTIDSSGFGTSVHSTGCPHLFISFCGLSTAVWRRAVSTFELTLFPVTCNSRFDADIVIYGIHTPRNTPWNS